MNCQGFVMEKMLTILNCYVGILNFEIIYYFEKLENFT